MSHSTQKKVILRMLFLANLLVSTEKTEKPGDAKYKT